MVLSPLFRYLGMEVGDSTLKLVESAFSVQVLGNVKIPPKLGHNLLPKINV